MNNTISDSDILSFFDDLVRRTAVLEDDDQDNDRTESEVKNVEDSVQSLSLARLSNIQATVESIREVAIRSKAELEVATGSIRSQQEYLHAAHEVRFHKM